MKNRKIIIPIIVIILIIIVIVMTWYLTNNDKEYISEDLPKIEELVNNSTKNIQGQYELQDLKINNQGTSINVEGKVKNNGSISSPKITMMLYDKEGNLKGKNETIIDNLESNTIRDFKINIIGDYLELDNYKIIIE